MGTGIAFFFLKKFANPENARFPGVSVPGGGDLLRTGMQEFEGRETALEAGNRMARMLLAWEASR